MAKEGYKISDIYQGGYSSLDPNSGQDSLYRIPAGEIGMATDFRTADVLKDISDKLKTGTKQIEMSTIQPEVFESIPNQHLKEVNRLSKLTGVDISVHAPLIEPSGLTQQGYSEFAREQAERQMLSAVERAHMVNPSGHVPVTFHSSSGWQGTEYKKIKDGEEKLKIPLINQESGQMMMVEKEEGVRRLGYSEQDLIKGKTISAQERIENVNATHWDNELLQIMAMKSRLDNDSRELEHIDKQVHPLISKGIADEKYLEENVQAKDWNKYQEILMQFRELYGQNLNSLFEKAFKYGSEEDKKRLIEASGKVSEIVHSNTSPIEETSTAISVLVNELQRITPRIYKPVEEVALDKTATTFGNIAFESYKKFKDTAPIVTIENPPAGGAFSRGEELKQVVEKSQQNFIKKAMSELGMSEKDAKAQAQKLLGVTWDVGHINMIRKYGYEGKDVVKETEKVAPLVKHVHLSDNFGLDHTELPMGMGNVPIQEIMQRLGKEGFSGKKVIEAGNWWQHFKTPPFQETLEAFGSPIYSMKMQPYWNQAGGFQQGYFSGYGQMLPQMNYETTGAGFSQLPAELGGQRGGGTAGSRMSGRPME
ncbi:MAG TPA: TIM barrel protein [Candidatus Pacearchaeota archaeon]|nr:TIM barrel protein [Candidatus Pacearchaeota archaeon]